MSTAKKIETVDFDVEINDEKITLTVPVDIEDAPLEVAEALEDNKAIKALSILIGNVGMQKLKSAGITTRQFSDILIPAWQDATDSGK